MSTHPSPRNSSLFAVSCRALLGAVIGFALLPVSALAQEQRIVIYADKDLGPSRLRHGFVHGVTYVKGRDYSRTVQLIAALKPRTWRLANHNNNVYGFVVGEAGLPQKLGTEIVVTIQDVFNQRFGYDVKVSPNCPPRKGNCFASYEAFRKAWLAVVNGAMKTIAEKNLVVNYLDVFGEPTTGETKLSGLTPEQFGDIFKATHDTVRQYRPNAKIVAPSVAGFGERLLKRFLNFVAENNIRLDALSWHEFETPEVVPAHVEEMREVFRAQPRLCNPTCPEIHINEYAPQEQYLIPGYGVGWLYYLEKARVDHANRACWGLNNRETTCWDGFEGMLLQDNVTPRPVYWAYKAYADMSDGRRLASEASMPRTVAIASKDESKRELRILAGRFGQKGASGRVAIEVRELRYGITSLVAEITRIPGTGASERGMAVAPAATREVLQVQNDAFSIVIPNFQDGDAYSIVLRPDGAR